MSSYITPLRDKITFHYVTAQFSALIALGRQILLAARKQDDQAVESMALVGFASAHRATGRFYDARIFAQGAFTLAEQIGNVELLVDALNEQGAVALNGYFQPGDALHLHTQALTLAVDFEYPRGMAQALLGLSEVALLRNAPREALAHADASIRTARTILDTALEVPALLLQARALHQLQDLGRAAERLRQALEICQKLSYAVYLPLVEAQIAWLHGVADAPTLKLLQQALQEAQQQGHYQAQVMILHHLVEINSRTAALKAYRYGNDLLTLAQTSGNKPHEASALSVLGALESVRHQADAALAHYAQALSIARENTNPFQELTIVEAIARCYVDAANYPQASRCYTEAISLAQALEDDSAHRRLTLALLVVQVRAFFARILGWLGLRQG